MAECKDAMANAKELEITLREAAASQRERFLSKAEGFQAQGIDAASNANYTASLIFAGLDSAIKEVFEKLNQQTK